MNISIQVDKSLFSSPTPQVGSTQPQQMAVGTQGVAAVPNMGAPNSSGQQMGGAPSGPRSGQDTTTSGQLFMDTGMGGPLQMVGSHGQTSASSSVVGGGGQGLQNMNKNTINTSATASFLPPIPANKTPKQKDDLLHGGQNVPQNTQGGPPPAIIQQQTEQLEQLSVNLTITKVGNNLISSKIDISKKNVPEQEAQAILNQEAHNQHRLIDQDINPTLHHIRSPYSLMLPVSPSPQDVNPLQPFIKDKFAECAVQTDRAGSLTPQKKSPVGSLYGGSASAHGSLSVAQIFQQPQENVGKLVGTSKPNTPEINDQISEGSNAMHDKTFAQFRQYDKRSLFILNSRWKIRQWMILFVNWHIFDQFMILSIAGNSILLAITDYTDDDNLTEWNQVLDKVDRGFTAIFIFEAVIKILAFGFVVHKRSYLRDPWNVLDFTVVIISLISMIPSLPNLKSLRTMRVIRPLRSINAVPSMKRLVATLLISLPRMAYLVIFMIFCIFIFGILGMQLFARKLYNRCRLTDFPTDNFSAWKLDESQQRLCGGIYDCNEGTYCHNLYDQEMDFEIDEVYKWDFIRYGIMHFDNIGMASLSIFRVITLEGWTGVMYNYLDSTGVIAGLFFPMLVVIGSFFLLNLFLAVIMETFSETSAAQKEKEELLKNAALKKAENQANQQDIKNSAQDKMLKKMIDINAQKMKLTRGGGAGLGEAALMFLKMNQGQNNRAHEDHQQIQEIDSDQEVSHQDDQVKEENKNCIDNEQKPFADKGAESDAQIVDKYSQSSMNCIQRNFLKICESQQFTFLITFAIIANTVVLGLDGYPQDEKMQKVLDVINIVFFTLFFLEMIIKIIGMGPRIYIKDSYNIFDAIIVCLSIIDVSISYSFDAGDISAGKGAISAFRAFRLIRIFKLAKSWTKLQRLIQMISKSLVDISSFSVLLFLLMFIYILLGMELFSIKMADEGGQTKAKIPRNNFNTFFSSFIVIFTVLTGENWDETMLQYARYEALTSIVFFISLIIIGVMIFLNLFLAILLDNFDDVEDDGEDQATEGLFKQLKGRLSVVGQRIDSFFNKSRVQNDPNECQRIKMNMNIVVEDMKNMADSIDRIDEDYIEENSHNPDQQNLSYSMRDVAPNQSLLPPILQANINTQRRVVVSPLEEIDEQEDQKNMTFIKSANMTATGIDFRRAHDSNHKDKDQQPISSREGGSQTVRISENLRNREEEKYSMSPQLELPQRELANNSSLPELNGQNENSLTKHKRNILDFRKVHSSYEADMPQKENTDTKLNSSHKKIKSFALIMYQRQQSMQIKAQKSFISKAQCEGNSLFILSDRNLFRVVISRITKSKYFEMIILLLICISSILLALDNPLSDPNSSLVFFLFYADYVLTAIFAIEAVFKIITFGFIFNKSQSYLRNGWNIIDFLVVIVSIVSLALTSNRIKTVKILRLLRVLRPLRMISRNKGLKIGIQALFKAMPNIFNVIVISLLFFVIFAIIGVNYFKGSFFSCISGNEAQFDVERLVETKWDCFNYGGAWVNADQNFDNVAEAMSTLFQMSTTEGWIDMMNRGVDSVAIDYQPVRNQNVYWALFFILFIILGNFFILNLFAGVVVSTFNKEKQVLEKTYLLSDNQTKWIEQKKLILSFKPKAKLGQNSNEFRKMLIRIVTSQKFEFFILGCIALNTIMLAMNWYSQTTEVDDIIDYVNYGFAIIYVLEALLKIAAFGPKGYFQDQGNFFDFVVVLASIASTIISIKMHVDFGSSATFIRALRTARFFTYISFTRQIKTLFETLVVTLPSLTNIGGLLLLFLYIYSVLGVFLFAEVKLQSNLDIHANFQSFGYAFMTLMRCSTGEAWDYIMMDLTRQRSITFQCSDDDFDYEQYLHNGMKTNGCGSAAGIVYFMTFYFMVPLIFLNLFIAIILEGFEQTSKKENSTVQEKDIENFVKIWAKYDIEGRGFIKISEFNEFLNSLGSPLGWDEKTYKDNQRLQDLFLEELNLPTYNGFKELLFWDVLQGLAKVCTIKSQIEKEYKELHSLHTSQDENVEDEGLKNEKNECQSALAIPIDPERKLALRLEIEFENINQNLWDVSDVEMIMEKERRIKRAYINQVDDSYTTGHIKAARKIMQVLLKMRAKKQMLAQQQQQASIADLQSKKMDNQSPKIIE